MKNIKQRYVYFVAGLFLIAAITGCVSNNQQEKVFTFAAGSGGYPPFNFIENGEIKGFDLDIGVALSEKMGMKPNPVKNRWESIIPGLMAKKYDAIIGSLTITDERKKVVSFSEPYYRSGAALFTAKKNTDIKSAADLKGKVIGVVKQTTYERYARNYTDDVRGYPSDIDAFRDLPSGRIDAVITDKFVGLPIIQNGTLDIKLVTNLQSEEIGIAVRKEDTELLANINKALDEIISDGTYDNISKKWFGENILYTNK
ncbi:MAG TPA: transporter substrate-binding domain-containing protein [Candidatus Methanoperedens sp.]